MDKLCLNLDLLKSRFAWMNHALMMCSPTNKERVAYSLPGHHCMMQMQLKHILGNMQMQRTHIIPGVWQQIIYVISENDLLI